MKTIGLVRRATPPGRDDLWVRVRARLRDDADTIRIRRPGVGWREAAALAVALGALAMVSDPLGFLVASGML